ncbi:hypothetical protein cce_4984 [Crocosphaera subtropica ATCC 51142]|uniref:Uncharacterized protein n=1 Tax=Crocosphaera subtropica (strain ATCC 51142 / BH68) TaxID=43989 RepID=B1X2G9_CROS5|nr:hypothetical protein [Crocosphaera subtropica]ACB54330.1 hypothetical protein cce_4984 [Crocosphaera subtropica ATCC 51142]
MMQAFDVKNERVPLNHDNQRKKRLSKEDTQFGYLLITIFGIGILGVLHADISFFILALLFGCALGFWDSLYGNLNNHRFLMRLVVVGALTGFFLVNFGGAAHALWLDNIEQWMTGAFPNATAIAELIFNVLRAAVVIYLAIAGVQIFLAIKRQEGFFEAAQLPLAALLIISVVDIIAGFVVT